MLLYCCYRFHCTTSGEENILEDDVADFDGDVEYEDEGEEDEQAQGDY